MPPKPLHVDPIAEARRQWIAHGWGEAADGMAAVTSVMRAHQLMLAEVEKTLRPFSLSFARFEMLRLLAFSKEGTMPMASATARLQVHPASVTNTVARLERDGLVRRDPHPRDGRAALLTITPAGHEITEAATAALNEQVFAQVCEEVIPPLTQSIAKLRLDAGDFSMPAPAPEPLV